MKGINIRVIFQLRSTDFMKNLKKYGNSQNCMPLKIKNYYSASEKAQIMSKLFC